VIRTVVLLVAGILMVLASFAHALAGWPHFATELEAAGAPADLLAPLSIGWHWGSAAMATFGLIVVIAAWKRWRGDRSGGYAVKLVSACWMVFGLATLVKFGFSGHFVGFIVLGALAWAPLLGEP
jgi:hypothetical protein